MLKKFIILFCLIIGVKKGTCQSAWLWNLPVRNTYSQAYSSSDHSLAQKVKFTKKNYRSALINYVPYYSIPNYLPAITINQMDTSDITYTNSSMVIFRDTGNNLTNQQLININNIPGSSYGKDFDTDDNDNYYVIGDNKNGFNDPNKIQIGISKKSSTGTDVWYKIYGGSNLDYAIAIRRAIDGNFIILGQTESNDGDVTNYNGGKDIWLFKISAADGSFMWKKTIGTSLDEIPSDLEILPDGSMLISGTAQQSALFPNSYNDFNAFLLKLDANGIIQWSKTYGGSGNDKIQAFAIINHGGFVSICNSNSNDGDFPNNNGGRDVYVIRHDAQGNIVWKKNYGYSGNDDAGDIAYSICDSSTHISFAKQFGNITQPYNVYPPFSQNTGITATLNYSGTETFFYLDNPIFANNNSTNEYFNGGQINSIASNGTSGQIFAANSTHLRFLTSGFPQFYGRVTRTFGLYDLGGVTLKLANFDTSICKGQPAWGVIFNTDSTYSDTLRNACLLDTLISKYTVRVINGDSSIVKDTTVCYGAIYNGAPVYTSFTKRDTVTVSTICGPKQIITSNNVNVAPPIINPFGKDTIVCKNQPVQLIAYTPASSYLWQDGSANQTYNAVNPGLYWVEVKDIYGCKKRDSMVLSNSDLFLITPSPITIQLPQTATLTPQTNGSVVWDYQPTLSCTTCQTTVANPTVTQVYTLSSQKENCVLTASITVIVNKNYYLYIPTAFTPDNNSNNDIYKVSTNLTGYFKMSLYNRYGQKVYETNDPNQGWDGNLKGAKQPVGGYTYIVEYDSNFTERQLEKGSFILIR
jgi:gliding motility-associated-like protein